MIEGVTLNPVVTDLLPEGLAYVDGSGVGVDGNGVPISNIVESFIVSGRTLTLDLISFQTAADNNPNNDFIRLSFDARVLTYSPTTTATQRPTRSPSPRKGSRTGPMR